MLWCRLNFSLFFFFVLVKSYTRAILYTSNCLLLLCAGFSICTQVAVKCTPAIHTIWIWNYLHQEHLYHKISEISLSGRMFNLIYYYKNTNTVESLEIHFYWLGKGWVRDNPDSFKRTVDYKWVNTIFRIDNICLMTAVHLLFKKVWV